MPRITAESQLKNYFFFFILLAVGLCVKGVLVVKRCGKVYATMGGITGGPGPNEDSEYEPKPPREREPAL